MQFSAATVLALLATAASAVEVAQLSALLSDLQQNSAQYVSYIQANPQKYPASIYALVQRATNAGALSSLATEWPSAEFSSFTSGFPGADRLSSEMFQATATGGAAAATSSSAGSQASSTAAASTHSTSVVSNSSSNKTSLGSLSSANGANAQLVAFPALAALSFLALI